MTTRIQYRRDTAANWAATNPVLAVGEPAIETDTKRRKIGDGATAWTALPYQFDKTSADAAYAAGGGSSRIITGPTLPALPAGTEYVWNKTDGAGTLLDILTGVA